MELTVRTESSEKKNRILNVFKSDFKTILLYRTIIIMYNNTSLKATDVLVSILFISFKRYIYRSVEIIQF